MSAGPDRTEARANRASMRRKIAERCPTPHKRAWLTEEPAQRYAGKRAGWRAFWCGCGCWHVTSWTVERYERYALLGEVRAILAEMYTEDGVQIVMMSRQRALGARAPADLIHVGRGAEVLAWAEALKALPR